MKPDFEKLLALKMLIVQLFVFLQFLPQLLVCYSQVIDDAPKVIGTASSSTQLEGWVIGDTGIWVSILRAVWRGV